MATNASTWFYAEPEQRAYLIEERVNHTFWSNRIGAIYFRCTNAAPPFHMMGEWQGMTIAIEWVPNDYFTLVAQPGEKTDMLIIGIKEILGFVPTISYVNPEGQLIAEWHVKRADERIQEVQGNPAYSNVKRYKR